MFIGELKKAWAQGRIEQAIVLRLLRSPGLPKKHRSGRETDFIYLLIFIPHKNVEQIDPKDFFIYLDRAGKRDDIKTYRSLFTVAEAMEDSGIENYIVFDGVQNRDYESAFFALKAYLNKRGLTFKPVELILDAIAASSRKDAKSVPALAPTSSAPSAKMRGEKRLFRKPKSVSI